MNNVEQKKHKDIALNIAIVSGIIAVFIGGWLVARYFYFYLESDSNYFKDTISPHSLSKIGLVLAETIIIVSITIFALFIKSLKKEQRKAVAGFVAALSLGSIVVMLIPYWKSAWYYIFDPAGNLQLSIAIFIAAALQGICFIVEALPRK